MLSNWLANRALNAEHWAMERHYLARSTLARGATLRLAEFAEDVRLWVDHHGDWRELRRVRRASRDRAKRTEQPPSFTIMEGV